MSVRERQSIVRKKSRRQTQEHQAKFGSETEEDDCKRFPCLLQKYCEERLYRFFPIIYNYLLRDDGQLIPIEHALCKGDNTEKLEKLAIYAYSNMEMKLKSITCKTAEGIDTRMFFALNQTLLLFPNLSTLKLDYCNLTSEHIPILQENLNTKKTVSELSLVGNPIKAQNYWRLIHCGLRVLVLKLCQINENGLKKIAKSVLNCSPNVSTLIHLDLSSNMVFDEGCQYIASILRCDRTIQSLNLTDCRIRDNGFKMLVACFTTFSLDKKEIVVRRKIRLEYFKLSQKVLR